MKLMTTPMRQVRYMHLAAKIADMLSLTRNEFAEFRALTRSLRRSSRSRAQATRSRTRAARRPR